MRLLGIHHVTAVCSDPAATARFYRDVLGLRLVKRTVNLDDPLHYHLCFGNERGTPGTLLTFLHWPGMPAGRPGLGVADHVALAVPDEGAVFRWARRLADRGVPIRGPVRRTYGLALDLFDPDGLALELVAAAPGLPRRAFPSPAAPAPAAGDGGTGGRAPAPGQAPRVEPPDGTEVEIAESGSWPEPVPEVTPDMRILGLHHVTLPCHDVYRSQRLARDALGLEVVWREEIRGGIGTAHWYFAFPGTDGCWLTYREHPVGRLTQGRPGPGLWHHVALTAADGDCEAWRWRLLVRDVPTMPVTDAFYFRSFYFRDPDGHLMEIASAGPGLAVDEPADRLGSGLKLPPWLEPQRGAVEAALPPL